MPGSFQSFQKASFDYLSDLNANNSKDWFEANRNRYETHWKAPALDLIDALATPLSKLEPPLKTEARINGSLRRINRDVRFSKDKSPFSPRMHLIFWAGSHPNRSSAFHLVLEPEGVGYGAGLFGLDSGVLKGYRDRIMQSDQRKLLLNAVALGQTVDASLGEPDLKRLPTGFQTDAKWEHLLRRKAFVMRTRKLQPMKNWLDTDGTVEKIASLAGTFAPFNRWLWK